jgi:hypothetical protein
MPVRGNYIGVLYRRVRTWLTDRQEQREGEHREAEEFRQSMRVVVIDGLRLAERGRYRGVCPACRAPWEGSFCANDGTQYAALRGGMEEPPRVVWGGPWRRTS